VSTVVAVLGLGEAGSLISRDLVAAGAVVRGYDPKVSFPEGVVQATSDADACEGAALVLSLTTAHESETALQQSLPALTGEAIYADLNTSAPGVKQRLAAQAADRGVRFADVAMMSPVPGKGLRTPMLLSGEAAHPAAEMITALGGVTDVLPGPAGVAASRKLLRSVFYKGMAAAVIEAARAAQVAGCEEWLLANISEELAAADTHTIERLQQGSIVHAVRRADEMAAAAEMLCDLGVPARVAAASRGWLVQLAAETAE
jgi:3-hydroxyisobutyrate dehydrogenase-like beta-hydroxyacid dehydrogenase